MATTVQSTALCPGLTTPSCGASSHQTPVTLLPPSTPNSGNGFNNSVMWLYIKGMASTAQSNAQHQGHATLRMRLHLPFTLLHLVNPNSVAHIRLTAAHSPSSFGLVYIFEDSRQLADPLSLHCSSIWQHNAELRGLQRLWPQRLLPSLTSGLGQLWLPPNSALDTPVAVAALLRSGLSMPTVTLLCHFGGRRSSVLNLHRRSSKTTVGDLTSTDKSSCTLVDHRCSPPDQRMSVPCLTMSVAVLPPAFRDLVDLQACAEDVGEHSSEAFCRASHNAGALNQSSDCLTRRICRESQSSGMETTVQSTALYPGLTTPSCGASSHQTLVTLSPPSTPNSGNSFNSSVMWLYIKVLHTLRLLCRFPSYSGYLVSQNDSILREWLRPLNQMLNIKVMQPSECGFTFPSHFFTQSPPILLLTSAELRGLQQLWPQRLLPSPTGGVGKLESATALWHQCPTTTLSLRRVFYFGFSRCMHEHLMLLPAHTP
eukprot:Gb_20512 [translate_table: standard]